MYVYEQYLINTNLKIQEGAPLLVRQTLKTYAKPHKILVSWLKIKATLVMK